MNIRQKKKKIKKRWKLDKIPKDVDVIRLDAFCRYVQRELTGKVLKAIDHDLLWGEGKQERKTDG